MTELLARGAAYEVPMPNGARDVYFAVRSFPGYGKLSRRKIDELVAGAVVRIDVHSRADDVADREWRADRDGRR